MIKLHLYVYYGQAKECFDRAISENSVSAYSEAFQLAEKALGQ